jgi:hypothetical protein
MALKTVTGWLYGDNAEEEQKKSAPERATDQWNIERDIRDREADVQKSKMSAKNALLRGDERTANVHFADAVRAQQQVTRLRKTRDSLISMRYQIEANTTTQKAVRVMDSAARAGEASNRRMPGAQVQQAAMRLSRVRDQSRTKQEIVDDALDDEEDVDQEDDIHTEIAAMREATAMEIGAQLPSVPLRSAASAARLPPELAPLRSGNDE